MNWVRGEEIGHGSFSTVSKAMPTSSSDRFPPLMAVKSSDMFNAALLNNEREVLERLGDCPQVIRWFGDDHTVENGEEIYNLFLEYASEGSLADHVKNGGLAESDVQRYTKSILKGLCCIHAKGFAHCDIKLQNILVFDNGEIKIADFGLAKGTGPTKQSEEGERKLLMRGTPLYMSPESVNDNEYESPADIWALGCAVAEMVTGKPVWNFPKDTNVCALLIRIGVGEELPGIPDELSEEGKDFLRKCFVKDPRKRWTAEMLLDHPFVAVDDTFLRMDDMAPAHPFIVSFDDTVLFNDCKSFSKSPRGPFDFPDWVSVQSSYTPSPESWPESELWFDREVSSSSSPLDRIQQLATDQRANWSFSDSWVTIR